MDILGVRVDNLSRKEILQRVEDFLLEEKFHQIATVNPEFILQAQNNTNFKQILNKCELNVADGIGIKFAFWHYGKHLKTRISGVDLMHEILKIANKKKLSVFLAASTHGLSTWQETATALQKLYPTIEFRGINLSRTCHSGLDPESREILKQVQDDKKDVLLCNFGAPQQELFIDSVKNDTIRLAMGVGGAFDFATGKIRRAPKIMRILGLEWLWRFLQEPKYRAKRIFRAVVVFPIEVIINKSANACHSRENGNPDS